MSAAAHVGDCEPIVFYSQVGRQPLIKAPWPQFTVIEDEFFSKAELSAFKRTKEGTSILVRLNADNGWAMYRRAGRDVLQKRSVWELIEGEYHPSEVEP